MVSKNSLKIGFWFTLSKFILKSPVRTISHLLLSNLLKIGTNSFMKDW